MENINNLLLEKIEQQNIKTGVSNEQINSSLKKLFTAVTIANPANTLPQPKKINPKTVNFF